MNAIPSPLPPAHAGADLDWEAALAEAAAPPPTPSAPTASAHVFDTFTQSANSEAVHNDLDFILDIPVQLTVELGRSKISVRNLLQIAQGSVLELDGLAGAPMDVLINGCLIAQGEVVVVNDKFGIRLTDITNPSERIRSLKR